MKTAIFKKAWFWIIFLIVCVGIIAFFYPKDNGEEFFMYKNNVGVIRHCNCFGLSKYIGMIAHPIDNVCYGMIYNCKYEKQIVKVVGQYVDYSSSRHWGTGCYLLDKNNKKIEVGCIHQNHHNYTENPNNEIIKIEGLKRPPQKVPDDYQDNKAGDYWPSYIEILNYEIQQNKKYYCKIESDCTISSRDPDGFATCVNKEWNEEWNKNIESKKYIWKCKSMGKESCRCIDNRCRRVDTEQGCK